MRQEIIKPKGCSSLAPGDSIVPGSFSGERSISCDMAYCLRSRKYGYDSVIRVTGWSQEEADSFQRDVEEYYCQGAEFPWEVRSGCSFELTDPASWTNWWFNEACKKVSAVEVYRNKYLKRLSCTLC